MALLDTFSLEMAHLLESTQPLTNSQLAKILQLVNEAATLESATEIVATVERSAKKCATESKYGALFVIDAILRHSRSTFGVDNPFQESFLVHLPAIIDDIFRNCLPRDKVKCYHILKQWQVSDILSSATLRPLLEMAHQHMQINSALQKHLQQASSAAAAASSSALQSLESLQSPTSPAAAAADEELYYLNEYYGNCTPTKDEPNYYAEYLATKTEHETGIKGSNWASQKQQQSSYCGSNRQQNFPQDDKSPSSFRHRPFSSSYDKDYEEKSAYYYRGPSGDSMPRFQSSYYHEEGESPWKLARDYHGPSPPSHSSWCQAEAGPYNRGPAMKRPRSRSRSRSPPGKRCRLPPLFVKPLANHFTLGSTTLWLGHLPTTITKATLFDAFIEYGPILDIVLVRAKECAFVCMKRRGDAQKAMHHLGQFSKQLRTIFGPKATMSWAPGKGLKTLDNYRDYWKYEIGQAFVPYADVKSRQELDALCQGCILDKRTIPDKFNVINSPAPKPSVMEPVRIKQEVKEEVKEACSVQVNGNPQ